MTSYKYVLLATDFSKPAETAAKRAAEIAACFNARLCLLHVIDHFPEDAPNDLIAPENRDPTSYITERSTKALELLSSQLKHDDIDTHVIISERSAAHEVTQYAIQNKIDLIVTGYHGHQGVADIIGSTASAVVHRAKCDTLLVRSDQDDI